MKCIEMMNRMELKEKEKEMNQSETSKNRNETDIMKMQFPSSIPLQMRGQVSLLLRSMRLQPTEKEITIPSDLSLHDYDQMIGIVESQLKKWRYQMNRRTNRNREVSEEEEVKTKKRRILVEDSDLSVCFDEIDSFDRQY